MNKQTLILTVIGALIISVLLVYNYQRNKRLQADRVIAKKKIRKNYLHGFYLLYQRFEPLKKVYQKQYQRVSLLYPADITVVNDKVTRDMTIGLGVAALGAFIVLISSQGSIFYIGMGIVATYVAYTHIINTRYERMYVKLLQQFKVFLSDVKSNYYSFNRELDTAIYMTIDESPYEISLHAQKFYDILSADDMELEAAKYNDIAPNSYFTTFSAICTTTWKYGDKEIKTGSASSVSNFIQSMNLLKDEVNIELLKIKRNMFLFSGLIWVSILPIIFIQPIKMFGTRGIKELAEYYTGSFGTIMMVIIFATSLICYNLVMNNKDIMRKEPKEQPLLTKLSNYGYISVFLTKLTNMNYSKAQRVTEKLKTNGERIGYKQFILKRIISAAGCMLAAQILIMGAQSEQAKILKNDFKDAFETSYQFTEADIETMEAITKAYIDEGKKAGIKDMTTDELTNDIKNKYGIVRTDEAQLIASEIITRDFKIRNNYYKWYYLFIVFLIGIGGYMLPYGFLLYRAKEMRMGMEDEVNQFQTIVMILMHVDKMSLTIILEWMERFAYCFKEPISKCIIDMAMDEEEALKELRLEPFEPFRRFVNNMLNVNRQGIVSAFEDIVSEKTNSNEERKIENQIISQKKADKSTLIAIVPLAVEIAGYLVYPLIAMSSQMLTQLNNSFG